MSSYGQAVGGHQRTGDSTPTRGDIILVIAIVLAAVAWTVGVPGRQVEAVPQRAVVELNGVVQGTHSLEEPQLLQAIGPLGVTTIEIVDGGARVVSSPCLNKICMQTGVIRLPGEIAVCVPNGILVRLDGGVPVSGFDGVTR